jgi:hypothetical protein
MNRNADNSLDDIVDMGLARLPVTDEAINQACSRIRVANWCDEARSGSLLMRKVMWGGAAVAATLILCAGYVMRPEWFPMHVVRRINPTTVSARHSAAARQANASTHEAVANEFQRLSRTLVDSGGEEQRQSRDEMKMRIQEVRDRVLSLMTKRECEMDPRMEREKRNPEAPAGK